MARAALSWSVIKLAEAAGVSKNTVVSFEAGKDTYASTAKKLRDAMLKSGKIRFEGDEGVYFNPK